MGDFLSNRIVVLGVALFAALYVVAGAMMASVGLIAFLRMPDLFSTGCIIWAGFVVFLSGAGLLLMSIRNIHISLHKSYVMILLCVTVLFVSIANIILVEIVEWEGVRAKTTSQDISADNNLTIFLTYLLGLLGSVIGLVASFFGTAYVYFTLTAPLLKGKRKNQPLYEVHVTKRNIGNTYWQKAHRKFNFRLTPPPESRQPASSYWGDGESDLYHVSWVYEDQEQGTRQSKEVATSTTQDHVVDNKALMDEIREKVGARRLPITSLDVTAQMNISSNSEPDQSSPDDTSELVLGRIGQLPPNAKSSFHRQSATQVTSTQL